MAITRRQFVTRLTALAAAAGIGQIELDRLTEAFAHGGAWGAGNWAKRPKVLWVHGAECTGCSTSLLSFFEDVTGPAIETPKAGALNGLTTLNALNAAVGGSATAGVAGPVVVADATSGHEHPFAHRTLDNWKSGYAEVDEVATGVGTGNGVYVANIADVLIDFIDLEYHETVQSMGGHLAYQKLATEMAGAGVPFILVVEGGIQDSSRGGAWNKTGDTAWCSIAQNGNTGAELKFDDVVYSLANQATCVAVVGIGQCATFGGYPACVSPQFNQSQTGSQGIVDFFNNSKSAPNLAAKCVNVPGCPTNPWWFILTVVALMVDLTAVVPANLLPGSTDKTGTLGILQWDHTKTQVANTKSTLGCLSVVSSSVDRTGRLVIVYPTAIHSVRCPNYKYYAANQFATHPGEQGCLFHLGCKGPATRSLCPIHGWNSTNPGNNKTWENGLTDPTKGGIKTNPAGTKLGNFCISAGAPCMGCTEKGYPDAFLPFVVR